MKWDLAATTAARLAPAGPQMRPEQIRHAVTSLREMADRAVPHVHQITGLQAAADLRDSQVLIVDRAGWAKANTQGFAVMLGSTLARVEEKAREQNQLSTASRKVSGTLTGAQLGGVLAFLSSKVLGQYDPFAPLGPGAGSAGIPGAGRLLLVAPNILTVEQELSVDPEDFRLWVCLHEQTHRVQFAAAPWLREYLLAEIDQLGGLLLGNMDTLGERLGAAVRGLTAEGPGAASNGGSGLIDLFEAPEEKASLSRLTAVMSLLEGHANVVMDAVDSSIVPTVRTIRQRFNARGKDRSPLEKFMRKLLGLDAKMRQYTDGARFVRAVVDEVGMDGFNAVWLRASNLPTEEEIHAPALWTARMGF